jgi:DGQHR domain-containing protein
MAKGQKKKIKPLGIDAIPVQQGSFKFYLFSMPASKLWQLTQINKRSEDKREGYQRALSDARVRNISKYIHNGGMLAGSIVVSFDEGSFDTGYQKLRLPNRKNIGWIIDGQHRLAGAYEASLNNVDLTLPVIAFLELSLEKQIELFITINKEARGVPASLYIDLLKDLPKRKTDRELTDERISDIARALDNDELSPFNQKIIFTRTARPGEISLNNFARILRPHISRPTGTLSLFTPSEQEGAITNYYKALQFAFPKAFKTDPPIFFRTIGFGAVWRAFPYVFNLTQGRHKTFSVAAIGKIFSEIHDFDFDKWDEAGTGSAAEVSAGEDIIAALEEAYADDDGKFIALKLD